MRNIRGSRVSTKPDDEALSRIEENQAALRDSNEQARELVEESERLVRLCRGGGEHDEADRR